MQCSGCYGTNFQSLEGQLVCLDCGEEIFGFREEDIDDHFTGTAVTHRHSQSSQALAVRATIESRRDGIGLVELNVNLVSGQLYLFEALFYLAKSVTDRLIHLNYATERIRSPLFQIISHLIRRIHAGEPLRAEHRRRIFAHHVLAMIALASVYVRSPLLPRDLCRLAVTQQIPYLTALTASVPERLAKNEHVQRSLGPASLPTTRKLVHAAKDLALGPHGWAPLRHIYGFPPIKSAPINIVTYAKVGPSYVSFPVGHESLTLLRLIRLLGLPDEFGARVMRWIELRKAAMRAYIGPLLGNANKRYPRRALLGRATDESLIVDIVNTMRLSYGRRRWREREKKFEEEWTSCKAAMAHWLEFGSTEDIDTVLWAGLSPELLATLRGKRLRRYIRLVDSVMDQKGEHGPELWGPFEREFKNISDNNFSFRANGSDSEDEDIWDESDHFTRTEKQCMYDGSHCQEGATTPKEGIEAMDYECGYDAGTDTGAGRQRLTRLPVRRRTIKRENGWSGAEIVDVQFRRTDENERRTKRFKKEKDSQGDELTDISLSNGNELGLESSPKRCRTEKVMDEDDSSEDSSQDGYEQSDSDESMLFGDDEEGISLSQKTEKWSTPKRNEEQQFGQDNKFWRNRRWVLWGSDEESGRKYARENGSQEWNMLWEPIGIGLALTIMLHFFDGCNVEVDGMEFKDKCWTRKRLKEIKAACNRTMKVTMYYVHDQLIKSEHSSQPLTSQLDSLNCLSQ